MEVQVVHGSSIIDVARDTMALARRTMVPVLFRMNGVTCLAHPDGDAAKLAANFDAALLGPVKFATSF